MDDQGITQEDFLALLQDIEHSEPSSLSFDTHASSGRTPDLFNLDLFATESETVDTISSDVSNTVVSSSSSSHVERCRMNRKRKKQELEELRKSAENLQTTLRRLTEQTRDGESKNASLVSTSWRDTSRRALVERQKAVMENNKLREMLRQHFNVARNIQLAVHAIPNLQALRNASSVWCDKGLISADAWLVRQAPRSCPRDEKPSPPSYDRSMKRSRGSSSSSSCATTIMLARELYHELFQNIHSAYERNVGSHDVTWLKIGTRKISMEMVTHAENDCMEMCVQVMECQRLPLSLAQVSDATWKHLSSPRLEAGKPIDADCGRTLLKSHGDDLFGECGSDCRPVPVGGDTPPGRLAIRRYVEPNQLTFVWECDGCFQCDGAKNPIGRVTERGWCTIEPSDGDPASSTTVFRIQVQYLPKKRECNSSDSGDSGGSRSSCGPPQHVNLSSEVALKLYRGTIARTFGAVEGEVFKETRRDCSSTTKAATCR